MFVNHILKKSDNDNVDVDDDDNHNKTKQNKIKTIMKLLYFFSLIQRKKMSI